MDVPENLKRTNVLKEPESMEEEKKVNEEQAKSDPPKEEPVKKEEAPASPAADKPVEEKAKTAEAGKEPAKKGNQPKATGRQVPKECATCAKPFPKKVWYYRDGGFYCSKKCYKKKDEKGKKKEGEKVKQ